MKTVIPEGISLNHVTTRGALSATANGSISHGKWSTMMRTTRFYWFVTGLFCLLMILSSIPDIMRLPEAVTMVHDHLGYPTYFLPYIGVAKLLGALTILQPKFPRLKEWAFAGLAFDLISAMYSSAAVGDPASQWAPISIGLMLLAFVHTLHHRRLRSSKHTD